MIDLNILDERFRQYRKTHFGKLKLKNVCINLIPVTYDIETYECLIGEKRQETTIHASCKLLSIGIGIFRVIW